MFWVRPLLLSRFPGFTFGIISTLILPRVSNWVSNRLIFQLVDIIQQDPICSGCHSHPHSAYRYLRNELLPNYHYQISPIQLLTTRYYPQLSLPTTTKSLLFLPGEVVSQWWEGPYHAQGHHGPSPALPAPCRWASTTSSKRPIMSSSKRALGVLGLLADPVELIVVN